MTWGDDGRPPAPAPVRPLGERLEERIAETGIRKGDLARAFGVSPATVSRWIRPLGERETMRGSGVPAALVGLVERWIEGGALPSAEELEAVPSRNGKPRR
jgi:transposase-like protein